ncbi:MAG: hypothetical protein K6E38_08755 [Fretibacterium sp.]|nr:hypothetical protein [Fretibacterium sp.]
MGLCPFHNGRFPSFLVSAERQNCFGFGKGGVFHSQGRARVPVPEALSF